MLYFVTIDLHNVDHVLCIPKLIIIWINSFFEAPEKKKAK